MKVLVYLRKRPSNEPDNQVFWDSETGKITEEPINVAAYLHWTIGEAKTEKEAKNFAEKYYSMDSGNRRLFSFPPSPSKLIKSITEEFLESKLEFELNDLRKRVNETMYHATPSKNVFKIMLEGLNPKSKPTWFGNIGKLSAPVIWLSESEESINDYLHEIAESGGTVKNGDIAEDWSILSIALDPSILLIVDPFEDEEVMVGSWVTYDKIPTSMIKVVGTAKFKDVNYGTISQVEFWLDWNEK